MKSAFLRATIHLEPFIRNREPMTDEQRKAMFASMSASGGGAFHKSKGDGMTPAQRARANPSLFTEVMQGFGEGLAGGANIAANTLTFGLTDLIGVTDAAGYTGPGAEVSKGAALVAREALVAAAGAKLFSAYAKLSASRKSAAAMKEAADAAKEWNLLRWETSVAKEKITAEAAARMSPAQLENVISETAAEYLGKVASIAPRQILANAAAFADSGKMNKAIQKSIDAIKASDHLYSRPGQTPLLYGNNNMNNSIRLIANAVRVANHTLANAGPMTDDQRKAMFASMGGGGAGPRRKAWSGAGKNPNDPQPTPPSKQPALPGPVQPPRNTNPRPIKGQPVVPPHLSRTPNVEDPEPPLQPGLSLKPPDPSLIYPAVMPPPGFVWGYKPNGERIPVKEGSPLTPSKPHGIVKPAPALKRVQVSPIPLPTRDLMQKLRALQ